MNTKLTWGAVLVSALLIGASTVSAQVPRSVDESAITYPIVELGSCKDKADCAVYCSDATHMSACVSFAEKSGLLKGEDLRVSKIVADRVSKGNTPGKCKSEAECKAFCAGKTENIKQCVAFAEELGVLPPKELQEAKNVLKALEAGAQLPGGCKEKGECETYCAVTSHIDECLSFAEAAQMLAPEELAQAKKVASFLKDGTTPGKCTTKASCDAYCADGANFGECVAFAEKAGLISPEDLDMAKKAGGAGPGGCRSKAECATYCDAQEHYDECVNFGIAKGIISKEDQQMIAEGVDQMTKALGMMPPEMKAKIEGCLTDALGADTYKGILNKTIRPTQDIGTKIKTCFGAAAAAGGAGMTPGAMPSAEDIKKMIPTTIPEGARGSIEDMIKLQMQGGTIPQGAPAPTAIPIEGEGGPVMLILPPPPGGPTSAPQVDCSVFAQVPSCDYVTDPNGHAACLQCK